jgi:hypothetical protein
MRGRKRIGFSYQAATESECMQCKEDPPVRKALLSLVAAALALSVAHSASAQLVPIVGRSVNVMVHPSSGCYFPLSEAYLAAEVPFTGLNNPTGIPGNPSQNCGAINRNFRWTGANAPDLSSPNTTAAPGVFSLAQRLYNGSGNQGADEVRQRIDFTPFARCPEFFSNAFVQSFRLTKNIPASNKCPSTYQAQTFVQFGSNIRTWWPLTYTEPGTTFTLELMVLCTGTPGGPRAFERDFHIDRWQWMVVVTFESLQAVIDLLHENPIGTSEIPCIAAENMYLALKGTVSKLQFCLFQPNNTATQRRVNAQNQLFNLEALITVFCVVGDCFESTAINPGGAIFPSGTFPPGNDPILSFGGSLTGIIDTPENPCCCKLLVDVERIGEAYNIVSTDDGT